MAIEAPISKYKKTDLKIYIVLCIVAGAWFAYDGYINKTFMEKHTNDDGTPDSTLVFNQKSPPFFAAAAVLFGVYLLVIKNKKLIADENELVFNAKKRIPYDSIQKIDKTHFKPRTKRKFASDPQGEVQKIYGPKGGHQWVMRHKEEGEVKEIDGPPEGFFVITYKNESGREIDKKISDRSYDNLAAILEHLVEKIS